MKSSLYKWSLFLLRISMGWLFFYAGITKVINPEWSAKGYLMGAQTFTGLFHWFASPGVLPVVDFLNQWGLTLIGVALILGIFVRLSSFLGALMMLLYYIPILSFPHVGDHSYIVDDHIIYIFVFIFFIAVRAGKTCGLDSKLSNMPKWLG